MIGLDSIKSSVADALDPRSQPSVLDEHRHGSGYPTPSEGRTSGADAVDAFERFLQGPGYRHDRRKGPRAVATAFILHQS